MEQQLLELLKEYTKHCEETKTLRYKKGSVIPHPPECNDWTFFAGRDIYISKSPDFADFVQWLENKINKQKE